MSVLIGVRNELASPPWDCTKSHVMAQILRANIQLNILGIHNELTEQAINILEACRFPFPNRPDPKS